MLYVRLSCSVQLYGEVLRTWSDMYARSGFFTMGVNVPAAKYTDSVRLLLPAEMTSNPLTLAAVLLILPMVTLPSSGTSTHRRRAEQVA